MELVEREEKANFGYYPGKSRDTRPESGGRPTINWCMDEGSLNDTGGIEPPASVLAHDSGMKKPPPSWERI